MAPKPRPAIGGDGAGSSGQSSMLVLRAAMEKNDRLKTLLEVDEKRNAQLTSRLCDVWAATPKRMYIYGPLSCFV